MHVDELKELVAAAAEARKKMYECHDALKSNRTLKNFQDFCAAVDAFNKILWELPPYMRAFPCRKTN